MGALFSSSAESAVDAALNAELLNKAAEQLRAAPFFEQLDQFEHLIEGQVLTPFPAKQALYTEARCRPFNQDMRGYPLVIAQPKNVADVVKCVNFVRDYGAGIKLCVCSGGHSNRCMMDYSFVIDLKLMNGVAVEVGEAENFAVVEGGAYLEDVDRALCPHGLGMVAGSYPQTGVGGWTLAGGYGWLGRLHGMGVDNLVEVEVVLATGELVISNDRNEHSSLIVGCRGGSGNFGIVTKFKFRAFKLPKYCHAGAKVFLTPTLASAVDVFCKADALLAETPDNCTGLIVCPGGAPVLPTLWGCFDDQADNKVQAKFYLMRLLLTVFYAVNSRTFEGIEVRRMVHH
jgi:FAD/FMN-containing dehydrogenase